MTPPPRFTISGTANFLSQSFLGATTDGFESADYGTVTLNLSVSRLSEALDISPGEMQDATYLTSLNSGQANDMVALIGTDLIIPFCPRMPHNEYDIGSIVG